jgi:hypothetical protein
MKKFILFIVAIFALCILSSCNQNDDVLSSDKITYVDHSFGYQLDYPASWFETISSSDNYASFVIKNKKDAVEIGYDFVLKASGSLLTIGVTNNIDYQDYEEFIKNSGTTIDVIAERMANIEIVIIGGKSLKVFTGLKTLDSADSDLYAFVYNRKLYNISFQSGSNEQFIKDKKIFDEIFSSFKFIE